jgi:hypothetical protein
MSRPPIPQTSIGKLVGLTVDNPMYYTSSSSSGFRQASPPPLIPLSASVTTNNANNNKYYDGEEKLMLWRNIANLFAKFDNIEIDLEKHGEATKRCTDDVYQELQDVRNEVSQLIQTKEEEDSRSNNAVSAAKLVRKIRKYVNRKCEKVRETVSYGSYNADNEIFDYVDKTRLELEAKNKKLEEQLGKVYEEMEELNETYYRDYEMFIKRENEMISKLNEAVKMNEITNHRMKYLEEYLMKQIQQARNYADTHVAGDLREEFSKAICREVEFESKSSTQRIQNVNDETNQLTKYLEDNLMKEIQQLRNYADTQLANRLRVEFSGAICREADRVVEVSTQLVQTANDELTGLITRSNEYHSMRYFGTVEDVNQLRETCETLKQSIGMVDAELSDTKETLEYLKDEVGQTTTDVGNIGEDLKDLNEDICNKLDKDYYELKGYIKHKLTRHEHRKHRDQEEEPVLEAGALPEENALQLIAEEYDEPVVEYVADRRDEQQEQEELIILDENMVISDDEDDFKHT